MRDKGDKEAEQEASSKSARKRHMHALQQLGERLVALPQAELDKINIEDDRLKEAIDEARRISARGGLKRQLQFIGKLMRSVDPTDIEAALQEKDRHHRDAVARHHQIEAARDKLILEGDPALGEILSMWPSAEPALLRQWRRQYPKEVSKGQEKAHCRKLFRYLAGLGAVDSTVD